MFGLLDLIFPGLKRQLLCALLYRVLKIHARSFSETKSKTETVRSFFSFFHFVSLGSLTSEYIITVDVVPEIH